MPSFSRTIRLSEREKSGAAAVARGVIALMDELVQIMKQEIELVKARKMEEHRALLQRKQRLTMDYRASIKSIAAQPDILKGLPDDVRSAVRASAQRLADMTDQNAKFLRSIVMATQRLIQNIISIVKQEALPATGYRNPKTAHLMLGGLYSPTCKPVTGSRTA